MHQLIWAIEETTLFQQGLGLNDFEPCGAKEQT